MSGSVEEMIRETLELAAAKQPEALAIIQQNGFVFERENLGNEPGNWSHLAFTLYTMLCEIENAARQTLEELE